jgi:ADP-ribose pyrophosphatase YjhB (NUDIX family)
VGQAPAEVAVREVREEVGLVVRPERLVGVYDAQRNGSRSPHHLYHLVFLCAAEGDGRPSTSEEALEVGHFGQEALPEVTPSHRRQVADAFAAFLDPAHPAAFDL